MPTPEEAFIRAFRNGGENKLRKVCCFSPKFAFYYAVNIDKKPRVDIRESACGDPYWAYYYALEVDRCPRDDTRVSVLEKPDWHLCMFMMLIRFQGWILMKQF